MEKNKKSSSELFPKSLLSKFIKEKIDNYEEPQRKNTPRGDPIGYSRTKYLASLMLLRNYKQKEIATLLEISHGLLRKWNTEEDFKVLVENTCKEFFKLALNHIEKTAELSQQLSDEWEKSDTDISFFKFYEKSDHYITIGKKFIDSKTYSKKLLNIFSGWIKENQRDLFNMESANYSLKLEEYGYVSGYILRSYLDEVIGKQVVERINEKILLTSINSIENILLSKKTITKIQRKKMRHLLETIKRFTKNQFFYLH
jgi:hypothetical protein